MKVIFYGGRQAGVVSLLTLLALKKDVVCVIPQDGIVERVAKELNLKVSKKPINDSADYLKSLDADLLVCCHGLDIINKETLEIPRMGGINLHPCLSMYRGLHPVERMLKDGVQTASVGVHEMTDEIDGGKVITELYKPVPDCNTVGEVYNELYPYYALALIDALRKVKK